MTVRDLIFPRYSIILISSQNKTQTRDVGIVTSVSYLLHIQGRAKLCSINRLQAVYSSTAKLS